jgi:hypothetical protein
MNDDSKPLTKKDLIEALGDLEQRLDARITGLGARITDLDEGLREYVHDTETRILKAFHVFSKANETRLGHVEDFAATAGKRLADLETSNRLADLEPRIAQTEKKLDRRQ